METMNEIEIIPSLLSVDFSCLRESINKIPSEINILHLDIMDGHFVNNITFGPFIVKQIRKLTDKMLDAHLMIENPEKYIDKFIEAGVDYLSFHYEVTDNPKLLIDSIKEQGVNAGIVINPDTDICVLKPYLEYVDYILIMSVYPGFAGQTFIEDSLNKIKFLKEERKERKYKIEIDGGINDKTAQSVLNAGADWLVTGSYLFSQNNIKDAINGLLNGK